MLYMHILSVSCFLLLYYNLDMKSYQREDGERSYSRFEFNPRIRSAN